MDKLKENLETLIEQHKKVSEEVAQGVTLKTKLEGAIEYSQSLIAEQEKAEEEKEESKAKGKSAKNGK